MLSGRSHLADQRRKCVVVEWLVGPVKKVGAATVMDRRDRQTRRNQVDPAPIDDLVVVRGCDDHGPAEVMGDTHMHPTDSARDRTSNVTGHPCSSQASIRVSLVRPAEHLSERVEVDGVQ